MEAKEKLSKKKLHDMMFSLQEICKKSRCKGCDNYNGYYKRCKMMAEVNGKKLRPRNYGLKEKFV